MFKYGTQPLLHIRGTKDSELIIFVGWSPLLQIAVTYKEAVSPSLLRVKTFRGGFSQTHDTVFCFVF